MPKPRSENHPDQGASMGPFRLSSPVSLRGRAPGQAWMVTFTDLVALMLAFFVLLFSMSQIEQKKWQGLVDALGADLDTLEPKPTRLPAVELHTDEDPVVPGADLDYLAPLLRQQISENAVLAPAALRAEIDRLVISLPAEALFPGRAAALDPGARELGFALGGLLRNLTNRVEITAHVGAPRRSSARSPHWRLALSRAALVTDLVRRAGYRQAIVSRGKVDELGPDANRLEIVIHRLAREAM